MNVSLSPKEVEFIEEKLKSGAYESAADVLREGLRLLELEDERRQKTARLQAEVDKGFAGPFSPWTSEDSSRVKEAVSERVRKE